MLTTAVRPSATLQHDASQRRATRTAGPTSPLSSVPGMPRFLQRRALEVDAETSPLEREADAVADQIRSVPQRVAPAVRLQTKRSQPGGSGQTAAPPVVQEALSTPGQPLDPATRALMEPRFGRDFSEVRVHTDAKSADSAQAVNASAYTVGSHIVFGEGHYSPSSIAGQQLLAHELTHVAQQGEQSPPVLQRQLEPAPTGLASGMSQEDAEYIAADVLKEFFGFYSDLILANTLPRFTHYRQNLMLQLDAIDIDAAIDRGVFTDPLNHMDEITTISEKIREVKSKLEKEHNSSKTLWTSLEAQFEKEKAELEIGSFAEQSALHILSESYEKTKQRVTTLDKLSVAEDFIHVINMIKNKSHLRFGTEQASRDEQRLSEEAEALSREMADIGDEGPGFLSKIWSVVGWDSPADFVGDVFLTIITFGASKYYRGAKRGEKALDLAKAARGARKLKYAKRLEKLDDIKNAAEKLVKAVGDHHAEISSLIKWTRSNAGAIARRIATDIASDWPITEVQGAPSVAISRLKKDYIQALVDEMLNVSEEQGKRYVELSHIALLGGKEASHQRMLKAFLSVAIRRRGVTNLIDAVVMSTRSLDFPTDLKAAGINLADIALKTGREVINDFLNGLPYIDKYRTYLQAPIEAVLKTIQKALQDAFPR